MSIRRSARRANFTTLDNCIFSPGLSFRAIGLLAYLLSKPDHWEVSVAQLVKFSSESARPDGRDSVYAILKELIDTGYIRRTIARDGGKLNGYEYEVFDTPRKDPLKTEAAIPGAALQDTAETETVAPCTALPDTDLPDTAAPYTAEPTQVKTDVKQSTERAVKTEPKAKASPAATPDYKVPEWVPAEAWAAFVGMRKAMGAKGKLTDRAAELIINELHQLAQQGHHPKAVLDQSTMNNWKGVFPLKQAGAYGAAIKPGMKPARGPERERFDEKDYDRGETPIDQLAPWLRPDPACIKAAG